MTTLGTLGFGLPFSLFSEKARFTLLAKVFFFLEGGGQEAGIAVEESRGEKASSSSSWVRF